MDIVTVGIHDFIAHGSIGEFRRVFAGAYCGGFMPPCADSYIIRLAQAYGRADIVADYIAGRGRNLAAQPPNYLDGATFQDFAAAVAAGNVIPASTLYRLPYEWFQWLGPAIAQLRSDAAGTQFALFVRGETAAAAAMGDCGAPLRSDDVRSLPQLQYWVDRVKLCDLAEIAIIFGRLAADGCSAAAAAEIIAAAALEVSFDPSALAAAACDTLELPVVPRSVAVLAAEFCAELSQLFQSQLSDATPEDITLIKLLIGCDLPAEEIAASLIA